MLQVMVRETEIKQTSFDTIYAVKYSKNETENYGANSLKVISEN
jgi:hypothetical protein